jgi:hypothetical protein
MNILSTESYNNKMGISLSVYNIKCTRTICIISNVYGFWCREYYKISKSVKPTKVGRGQIVLKIAHKICPSL